MSDHRLFNNLRELNPTDDEIAELYEDLRYVFDSPFDNAINEAIIVRKCAYIEAAQPYLN